MPIEFDGPNSKVSADTIAGQGGSTITIQSGHSLSGSGASLTALNATQLTSGTIPIARIADDAVTTAKIAPDAITAAKIADDVINSEHYAAASIDNEHLADDAVGVAELSATGTANNTTFLRGDNAWAEAGGGAMEFLNSYSITGNPSTVGFANPASNSGISTARRTYVMYFSDVDISADADIRIELNVIGAGWSAANGHGWAGGGNNGATVDRPYSWNYMMLNHSLVDSTNATSPINGHVYFATGLAGYRTAMWGQMIAAKYETSPGYHHFGAATAGGAQGVIDGVRLALSTGTFTSGTLNLYGMKTS